MTRLKLPKITRHNMDMAAVVGFVLFVIFGIPTIAFLAESAEEKHQVNRFTEACESRSGVVIKELGWEGGATYRCFVNGELVKEFTQ